MRLSPRLPSRFPPRLLTPAAFVLAALVSVLAATWAASAVEKRSEAAVRGALDQGGFTWAEVQTDGLQVILTGTAPSESVRFRAIAAAGEVVDPARVNDAMEVTASGGVKAPDFSVEILRNSDGISLIGLVPADTDREEMVERLASLAGEAEVTDLLDVADNPVPPLWGASLEFGLDALESLPRAKISVGAGTVFVSAISDSAAEKARLEADLAQAAPDGVKVTLDISAPRPVITPFSVRFLIDPQGARFDACAADSEAARDRILAAAAAAGAQGKLSCTVGLGVPSPSWADAVVMAIEALADAGGGSVTFSDADISLVAAATVTDEAYDRAIGTLESNLPEVFSLKATRAVAETPAAETTAMPEFTAVLNADGKVTLNGRIPDERTRNAVEGFARAVFGTDSVSTGMRLDAALPQGWPVRVLAALEALGEVETGSARVRATDIRIEGVSGSTQASDTIARILTGRLGADAAIEIAVRYDEKLDPLQNLPTPEQCAADINEIMAQSKITFEPGSAIIDPSARDTLDKIAEVMKQCSDFPMEVGGHTDAQGRDEMNLTLSQDRAQAVINALMERRILTGHLTAKGYGESVPVAENDSEEGREANRRIEFKLVTPEDVAAAAAGIVVQTPGKDTLRPKARPGTATASAGVEEKAGSDDGDGAVEGSGDAVDPAAESGSTTGSSPTGASDAD